MSGKQTDIQTILDELVHQFSDPLALFRELVQNAIDSGTSEVEARLDFEAPDGRPPRAVISVQDWGEGMDRSIIEDKFLRLFSSNKDRDLTKVGRFGIGFISVFAIEPQQVVVDTGRSGEYWRVVFGADRSYELYSLDWPVEGTRVRIIKPMARQAFEELRVDARKALSKWCRHPEIPICFEGRDVRRDFALPSKFTTTYSEEGTRVVMGFNGGDSAPAGYYNRGLTLREGPQSRWPWASYKIDSRYLEHTLSRDQLLEDGNYAKAIELLEELAVDRLPGELVDELQEMADDDNPGVLYGTYCGYLAHYLECGGEFRESWQDTAVFRSLHNGALTHDEVREALGSGCLHLTRFANMPAGIPGGNHRVLIGYSGMRRLLEQCLGRAPGYLEERYLIPELLPAAEDEESRQLNQALGELLEAAGVRAPRIVIAPSRALPVGLRSRVATIVSRTGESTVPARDWKSPGLDVTFDELERRQVLIINADADSVGNCIELAELEPEWAAYALLAGMFGTDCEGLLATASTARLERAERSAP